MSCYRNSTTAKSCTIQRGRGAGGILRSLYNQTIPAVKSFGAAVLDSPITQAVLESTKEAVQAVAKDAGLNIVKDTLDGQKVSKSIKANLKRASEKISGEIIDKFCKQVGRGEEEEEEETSVPTKKQKKEENSEEEDNIFDDSDLD